MNADDTLAMVIDLHRPSEDRRTLLKMLGSMGRALERVEGTGARFLVVGREPGRSWHVAAAVLEEDRLAEAMVQVQSKMSAAQGDVGSGTNQMVFWRFLSLDAERVSESADAGLRRLKRQGAWAPSAEADH